ncbi:hypothetical protein V6N11_008454 [Hibiscus sabdariffa]|uniref:Uncharacterized protein n=1 Tax=Hibiscus sabdariffa TaxID=183260 RepID=A0ABR1ZMG9_9ROSI
MVAEAVGCACEDEAGVDGFVDEEKPEKEPELPNVVAAFVTPNPVKGLTAADVVAELAGAADEAVAAEDEELKLKAGNDGVGAVVVLAAGVEAVVVTVENNGADDDPKDKDDGFDTAAPENVGAGDDEAALPNPNAVLFKNGEVPPKENPDEDAELEKLGKDGVVTEVVEAEDKEEPKELVAVVVAVAVAGACEDENRVEPLLAPNGDEDVPKNKSRDNKEAGFDKAAPETVAADDDDEAALPKPKLAVNEGGVVEAAADVELSVLFEKDDVPRYENPVEAEKGEVVVEFEAELDDMKLEKVGVVPDDEEEPKERVAVSAGEDENRVEPLLAPKGDGDAPTFSEIQKIEKNVSGKGLKKREERSRLHMAAPEKADAGDADEAGLPNPKEEDEPKEKAEELEEVEAAVNESAVTEVVGVELALLEKENPVAAKGDADAELEAELDENMPENEGVVAVVAVAADEDENAKLKGLVVAAADDEDENREEPLLAPNRGEVVPNPAENYKFNPKQK